MSMAYLFKKVDLMTEKYKAEIIRSLNKAFSVMTVT